MSYEQRQVSMGAAPQDRNERVVGDMCRVDSVRSDDGEKQAGLSLYV